MEKIATPDHLVTALESLLRYTEEAATPSRSRIAAELMGLADRVALRPERSSRAGSNWASVSSSFPPLGPSSISFMRAERLVLETKEQLKRIERSMSQYRGDPGKYAPQLGNAQDAVRQIASYMKIMSRALDTEAHV